MPGDPAERDDASPALLDHAGRVAWAQWNVPSSEMSMMRRQSVVEIEKVDCPRLEACTRGSMGRAPLSPRAPSDRRPPDRRCRRPGPGTCAPLPGFRGRRYRSIAIAQRVDDNIGARRPRAFIAIARPMLREAPVTRRSSRQVIPCSNSRPPALLSKADRSRRRACAPFPGTCSLFAATAAPSSLSKDGRALPLPWFDKLTTGWRAISPLMAAACWAVQPSAGDLPAPAS